MTTTTSPHFAYGHAYMPPAHTPDLASVFNTGNPVWGIWVFPPVMVPSSQATYWSWVAYLAGGAA